MESSKCIWLRKCKIYACYSWKSWIFKTAFCVVVAFLMYPSLHCADRLYRWVSIICVSQRLVDERRMSNWAINFPLYSTANLFIGFTPSIHWLDLKTADAKHPLLCFPHLQSDFCAAIAVEPIASSVAAVMLVNLMSIAMIWLFCVRSV